MSRSRSGARKREQAPPRHGLRGIRHGAPSSAAVGSYRFYRSILVAIACGGVPLQILAMGPLRDSFWGFHLAAFLPLPFALVSWLVVVAASIVLLMWDASRDQRSFFGGSDGGTALAALPPAERSVQGGTSADGPAANGSAASGPGSKPRGLAVITAFWRRADASPWLAPGIVLPLLGVACGIFFWLLRSRQSVLGDAWPLVTELPKGLDFHPRQPLTMALQQLLYRGWSGAFAATKPGDVALAWRSVAAGSIACGVLFALVAYGLAWISVRVTSGGTRVEARGKRLRADATGQRATVFLACLVLVSQGYAQLFFGYLENYAFHALTIALYLLVALLHLRGRLPLLVPLAVFVLDLGLHLSAVALLPSVVFLGVRALLAGRGRAAAIRDLALCAVLLLLLDQLLRSMAEEQSLWRSVRGIVHTGLESQGGGAGVVYLLSAQHHRDFFNAQYLIGPLGVFLLVPALLYTWWRRGFRRAEIGFASLAAMSFCAASWATSDPALGYARDWDLFAPAGVAFTLAGLLLLLDQVPGFGQRVRLLGFGLLVSVLHLGAWAGLNHSETRAMQRFASLPLGLGRTEVALGNWHLRNGRTDEASVWFERALAVNPRSNTAHAFLGLIHGEHGRMDLAAEAYRRASSLRPDFTAYRMNLIRALQAQSRWGETLPHYEVLCRQEPRVVEHWLGWSLALRSVGREGEARALLQRALELFVAEQRRRPTDYKSNMDAGVLLARLERADEALQYFLLSLRAQPDSDTALYQVGSTLVVLGRVQEARPYLMRLLEINPEHFRRDQVRAWIDSADPG